MFKRILLATAFIAASASIASAAPIVGSFSLGLSSGAYVTAAGAPTATATTAAGLDFGMSSLQGGNGAGNGYGTNGSAVVYNAIGSFTGLNGSYASVSDLALSGGIATPYTQNPFISLASFSVNISGATYVATDAGIVVKGSASFSDGVPADATSGTFTLSTSTQPGSASSVLFTFTSNVTANAVPEPVSLVMLGTGLIGLGIARSKRRAV